jgi:hypothetical protein
MTTRPGRAGEQRMPQFLSDHRDGSTAVALIDAHLRFTDSSPSAICVPNERHQRTLAIQRRPPGNACWAE